METATGLFFADRGCDLLCVFATINELIPASPGGDLNIAPA